LRLCEAVNSERSCFKASSGDHPRFRIARMPPIVSPSDIHATFLLFHLQNIFLSPLRPGGRCENAGTNRLFPSHFDRLAGMMTGAHV
jgi:hypothetical protein